MRVIVVGLGVQGRKRREHSGKDVVAIVDPLVPEADFRELSQVPIADFDAALVCTPDEPKRDVLEYLISNGKHVLVEKPLWAADDEISRLESLAGDNGVVCYTAYNHRFEPHFVRMKSLIDSGILGKIYRCRLFYGNGTARLVRESEWRDQGAGVLPDLGSHLLDTIAFWFGDCGDEWSVISANRFENAAADHVVLGRAGKPSLELEMTLLSWRNHFTADVLAENGSAHISSLCKWGPSTFIHRTRVMPSGTPPEDVETLEQDDPTWALEYEYFKGLVQDGAVTNLDRDRRLNQLLGALGDEASGKASL